MQHSNLFDVVATLQNSGVEGVATGCPMSPGVPAQSMLAVAASDCHEVCAAYPLHVLGLRAL